jgi:hypothetical protein
MYSYDWDPSTGGYILNSTPLNFSKEPRPVYYKVNVKKPPPGLLGGGCVMLVSFSSVYGNSRGFRETRA